MRLLIRSIKCGSYLLSAAALLVFLGLFGFLGSGSGRILQHEGLSFWNQADWFFRADTYGAASMLYGSIVVGIIAMCLAAPISLAGAIFTAEYLRGWPRTIVKGTIELLAGIPSVVYGLLGVLYLRPIVFEWTQIFLPESGDTLLTAGILVGIMIIPTVLSLSDDAFRSVSQSERETSRALGLTDNEVFFHAIFPRAFPGVIAAVLLALGRAVGETIAVYLVVGRADNRLPDPWYSLQPLVEAGQTLTSKLGGSEVHMAYGHSLHWSAIVTLGFTLLAIVMFFVILSEVLLIPFKKYRMP